jgi:hypothetical protein
LIEDFKRQAEMLERALEDQVLLTKQREEEI